MQESLNTKITGTNVVEKRGYLCGLIFHKAITLEALIYQNEVKPTCSHRRGFIQKTRTMGVSSSFTKRSWSWAEIPIFAIFLARGNFSYNTRNYRENSAEISVTESTIIPVTGTWISMQPTEHAFPCGTREECEFFSTDNCSYSSVNQLYVFSGDQ